MEAVIYLFKINLAIAIFCVVYRTIYRKDTFFLIRRYMLQSILLLSIIYPFVDFSFWMVGSETMTDIAMSYKNMLPEIVVYSSQSGASGSGASAMVPYLLFNYFLLFYVAVTCFLLLRILFRAMQIVWLRLHCDSIVVEGIRVNRLEADTTPFSFFSWVFINPDMHNEKELHEVLAHEMVHVRQRHSIDVLAAEFICAFCWINPFVWMLKKEIQKNLEFLVDNCVINKGEVDIKSYQYHLLKLAYHPSKMTLANQFNISPLKERIMMINVKKSPKMRLIAYTLILPLALLFLVVNNISAVAERLSYGENVKNVVGKVSNYINDLSHEKTTSWNNIDNSRYTVSMKGVNNKKEISGIILSKETKEPISGVNIDEVMVVGSKRLFLSDKSLPEKKSEEQSRNNDVGQEDVVYVAVEKMPEYPGGDTALLQYISENINYPVPAAQNGIQGRVSCVFTVNVDGSVSNVEVVRNIDPLLDKEAIRVLSTLPKFIPGEQRGKKVAVQYSIPVRFQLKL